MSSQHQRVAVWIIVIVGIVALGTPRLRSLPTLADSQAEHFQRTFTVAPNAALNVDNYKGTIHVTGAETNQIVVDVTKRFEGSDSDRKWWMENIQVNFHNDNDRVAVEVKYPNQTCFLCWMDREYTASVELEIHVPRKMNIQIESYKPDIRIASLEGDIRIKSYKSPITIESTTGAVRIDTYKDTLTLRKVNIRGPLEVKSYKADVEISATALGDSVNLETYKGSFVLRVPEKAGLDVDF